MGKKKNKKISADAALDEIDREWLSDYENQLLAELNIAYHEARKGKRRTLDEQLVEVCEMVKLVQLRDDLIRGTYEPSRGVAHVISKPVIREIFAAPFRDRILHHWIYDKIYEWWDRHFIFDSYSCREGKGTLLGIQRLDKMVRRASGNYAKTVYVVKMDIQGYFMSLNRKMLCDHVLWGLERQYKDNLDCLEYKILKYAIRKIIFDDPVRGVRLRGWPKKWEKLPKNKSLLFQPWGIGIVIGNLTSQLFSNIYLDLLDRFIKFDLGYKYYGRYVDDFYIVVTEDELDEVWGNAERIRAFLERMGLKLHPKKFYIQKIQRGVQFLGGVVYPGHIQPSERLKGNFRKAVKDYVNGRRPANSMVSYRGHTVHLSHREFNRKIFKEVGWYEVWE